MVQVQHYTPFHKTSYKTVQSQKIDRVFTQYKFVQFQTKQFCGCRHKLLWL